MAKKSKVLIQPESVDAINWAIVCHLKPYQLAYKINSSCGWNLQRLRNLKQNQPAKTGGFALFAYHENEMQPEYFLIALKDDKSYLIRDLRQFDYILQVRLMDEDTRWDADALLQRIKSMEQVLGVFELQGEALKNADTLFFDRQLDELELQTVPGREKKISRLNI